MGFGGLKRLFTRQMACRWLGVGASMCQRSLQDQEQMEENEVSHPETSCGALSSRHSHFQIRLPLESSKPQSMGRAPLEMPGNPRARASRLLLTQLRTP